MNKTSLHSLFEQLGLNKKEQQIYETLLRIGPSSSSIISREVNLPRQTVYSALTKLVSEGFIEEGIWKGTKRFVADPKALVSVLDLRSKKAEKLKEKIEELLPILTSLSRTRKSLPKITYYEGEHGLKRLLDSIIEQYEKGANRVFRGFGVNFFSKTSIKELLYDFVETRYKKYKVETRLIISKGEDDFLISDDVKKLGRTIKYIDIDSQNSAIYLVADKIYLFSYDDEIGIMIENKQMTNFLISIFDAYWKGLNQTKF